MTTPQEPSPRDTAGFELPPDRAALIEACKLAVQDQEAWQYGGQLREIGFAWALLNAGCEFTLRIHTEEVFGVRIAFRVFGWFDAGEDMETRDFTLPRATDSNEDRKPKRQKERPTEEHPPDEYTREGLIAIFDTPPHK